MCFHIRNDGFHKNGFVVSYHRTAGTWKPEYSPNTGGGLRIPFCLLSNQVDHRKNSGGGYRNVSAK